MLQKTNPDVSGTVSAVHRRSFWVILGLYCLLALLYVYATPLFEAPDESYHYAFVHRMANGGALPVQERGKIGDWHQEGSQPPLYYFVEGTLLAPFERRGLAQLNTVNPHAVIGHPGITGNKNHYLHTSPYPPPLGHLEISGAVLRVYLARLVSVGLGLVTVAAVYGCARELLPLRPNAALLAAALTAFNPQFIFISASVNNDTMVTALNSVALWQIMTLVRAERFDLRRSIFLAVVVALATLSKLSGLVMVPVAALAGLWVAYRSRDLRGLFILGGLMLTVWLALAGWWYARNLTLYNELLGSARMLDVFGRRAAPPLPDLLVELSSLFQSYWGVFGWFSILTAQPYYTFTTGLTLAGFSGLLLHFWRIRAERIMGMRYFFLSLAWVLGFISLLMWTLQTAGTQGRLLFPYIAAASPLLAVGLLEWGGRLRELLMHIGDSRRGMIYHAPTNAIVAQNPAGYLGLFIPVALMLCALLIPLFTLIPVYLPPAPIPAPPSGIVTASDGSDVGVFLTEDGTPAVALAGYQTDVSQRYAPGDTVSITLYWRPFINLEHDYSLYIHLTRTTDGAIIGQVDTFPGWGSWRTSLWVPPSLDATRYLIPDVYTVLLNPDAEGASALDARVGWWHPLSDTRLASTNPGNIDPYALVLRVGGFVGRETLPDGENFQTPAGDVGFSGIFALVGYRLDDDGLLTLMWEMLATPQADYTVVALLTDEPLENESSEFSVIAQADSPPDLPTRYRRAGERFLTVHRWQYAEDGNNQAKTLPIYVGWYDTSDPAYPRLETDSPHNLAYVADMPFEP